MGRILTMGVVGAAALAAAAANAQSTGEMTIYSKGHFKGPSLGLGGPLTHIDPPFPAKSIQLAPGSAWEICSGNTFSRCKRIDKSVDAMVFAVRSARPIAPVVTTSIGPGASPGTVDLPNQALRGFASQFFVAPNQGGQRVGMPKNDPAAVSGRADEFCRAAGWQGSAYARLQNVGGTYYLIDTLCTNRDR
jgi:hypothetical protein